MAIRTRLAMINWQAWQWVGAYGTEYQAVRLNGSDTLRVYYRVGGTDGWEFGHSRELNGRSVTDVVREACEFTSAPPAERRCATLRCNNVSTQRITYTVPEDRSVDIADDVCDGCARDYLSRPSIRATAQPLS